MLFKAVLHRIDDLENPPKIITAILKVLHRIDDLENCDDSTSVFIYGSSSHR